MGVAEASAEGSLEVTLSDLLPLEGPWSVTAAGIGPGSRPHGSLEVALSAVRDSEVVAGYYETGNHMEVSMDGRIAEISRNPEPVPAAALSW